MFNPRTHIAISSPIHFVYVAVLSLCKDASVGLSRSCLLAGSGVCNFLALLKDPLLSPKSCFLLPRSWVVVTTAAVTLDTEMETTVEAAELPSHRGQPRGAGPGTCPGSLHERGVHFFSALPRSGSLCYSRFSYTVTHMPLKIHPLESFMMETASVLQWVHIAVIYLFFYWTTGSLLGCKPFSWVLSSSLWVFCSKPFSHGNEWGTGHPLWALSRCGNLAGVRVPIIQEAIYEFVDVSLNPRFLLSWSQREMNSLGRLKDCAVYFFFVVHLSSHRGTYCNTECMVLLIA